MASFSSQKSSFQYLYDAPLQGRITTLDDYFTSHVCGFCATSLGVRSGSRPAHQVTGQGFPAGMFGARQNYAQVGSSSGFIIINETAVYISKWGRWGILGWRHSPKMADAQMFVPVSIGFGKTALVPARFEYSAWQMCVRERKHSTSTCGISTSGTWLPGEESAADAGAWVDHGTGDCSLESDGTGAYVMSRASAEALHPGLGKNPGGTAANVYSLEPQHQRYHEEPHKPMDRGDLSRKPTLKLIVSMTVWQLMRSEHCQLHGRTTVRWLYLTSCQRLSDTAKTFQVLPDRKSIFDNFLEY